MILVLPVPPSANKRYARNRNGGLRLTDEARAYKDAVYGAFLRQVRPPFPVYRTGRVELHMWWYRGSREGDGDNRQKALFDALQHLAYTNDNQITRFHVALDDDPEHPHVLLHLAAL